LRNGITDLEFSALYSGQQTKPGIIKYYRQPLNAEAVKREIASGWSHATSFGFFPFHERVDVSLRKSGNATVRARTEAVNGSNCYVVEADTTQGQLTVWIDPAHGYNVAKTTVTQKEGDLVGHQVLPRGHETSRVLTNTSFKQVDGAWIPVAYVTQTRIMRPGFMIMEGGTHSEITEFLINPDHEAMKSFEVNDFPEGGKVAYFENGRVLPVWFVWKDGRPVPDVDPSVNRELDQIAESLRPGADPNAGAADATGLQVLADFSATRQKLQSFLSQEEITVAGQEGTERCAFRSDGNRVRLQNWFPDATKPSATGRYESFLWDGTRLVAYATDPSPASPAAVHITSNPDDKTRLIAEKYRAAPLMGYLAGEDIERVLRSAPRRSVRTSEIAAGSPCRVVEAATGEGTYQVWFDPQRGSLIVKAEVRRRPRAANTPGQAPSEYVAMTVDQVRCEQIEGVWVPMEADIASCAGLGAPVVRYHVKRTEFRLHPDHERLGSFAAHDIPEGTPVSLMDAAGRTQQGIWKGGQAVWKD
jgi:hypothetical protein